MERSYRVGFVNERSRGALGYQFDSTGVDNWFAKSPFNSSLLPAVGDVVTFDTLSVPYAFALTAAYDTGMIDTRQQFRYQRIALRHVSKRIPDIVLLTLSAALVVIVSFS